MLWNREGLRKITVEDFAKVGVIVSANDIESEYLGEIKTFWK